VEKSFSKINSKFHKDVIKTAQNTIKREHEAIGKLLNYIDEDFSGAVAEIFESKGRLILTGIGKSAIIAQKITATLNSTGTPAVFMHAADAIHGDLGIILEDDLVLCLSKSGNTPEIKVLLPLIRQFGNRIIAMTSEENSYLAKKADYVLLAKVSEEACPNNLAPTSSTTAQLVMGDALAVSLLNARGFTEHDFARYHPGGVLGKKLYLRVSDLYSQNEKPAVKAQDSIDTVIMEISSKRLGATAVINTNNEIKGVITDGDLRRMLQKGLHNQQTKAGDIMSKNPKTVSPHATAVDAFFLMKKNNITQLLVAKNNDYKGVIHIHDILKEGIV
jgi:arabinose-5-phosphate isomerase